MVNIHFYDALASGANPQEGQVLRYHCIRVGEDGSFQTKKSAVALRDDVFIDPQYALDSDIAFLNLQEGVSELEWAKSVYQDFTSPQSLFIGLGNSTRVDPALRQVFYRSLLPYPAFGFPAGAHYLDIETLLAAILVLRPTEYPFDPKIQPGKGSALYQYLMWDSSWEGDNRAQRIRDVLAEVAKASPRMLEHAISISGDKSIRNFLGLEDGAVTGITGLKPVVGIHSSLLTSRPVSVLVPMAVDPSYPDFLYMIDLESDLTELLSAKDESLSKCVRKTRSDLTKPLIRVSLCGFHADTHGELDKKAEKVVQVSNDRGYSRELALCAGDRIMLRKNSKLDQTPVFNGDRATVISIEDYKPGTDGAQNEKVVHARLDRSGTVISWRLSDYDKLDHAYAMTVHKSQGLTVENAFYLASETTDRRSAYVAFTRSKAACPFYLAPEDESTFANRTSLFKAKMTALDADSGTKKRTLHQAIGAVEKTIRTLQPGTKELLEKTGIHFSYPGTTTTSYPAMEVDYHQPSLKLHPTARQKLLLIIQRLRARLKTNKSLPTKDAPSQPREHSHLPEPTLSP